jgi:hypothetical protein
MAVHGAFGRAVVPIALTHGRNEKMCVDQAPVDVLFRAC